MPQVVPVSWMPLVRKYLSEQCGDEQDHAWLGGLPYDRSVLIRFPDSSQVLFKSAFAVADETTGQVAVFTKSCGFHVFPMRDAEIEVLRPVGPSGDT